MRCHPTSCLSLVLRQGPRQIFRRGHELPITLASTSRPRCLKSLNACNGSNGSEFIRSLSSSSPLTLGEREGSSSKNGVFKERKNPLEDFNLSQIPVADKNNAGVTIDNLGRLEITDPELCQRPHKTALMLLRSQVSLTERDFLRLLPPSPHLQGWRSQGGLEQSK